MFQGYALQKLHGDELAVFVTANFVDRANVRVVERGIFMSFHAEAAYGFHFATRPETVRMTLLAAFCHLRTGELIDTLCDLLTDMVNRAPGGSPG